MCTPALSSAIDQPLLKATDTGAPSRKNLKREARVASAWAAAHRQDGVYRLGGS